MNEFISEAKKKRKSNRERERERERKDNVVANVSERERDDCSLCEDERWFCV